MSERLANPMDGPAVIRQSLGMLGTTRNDKSIICSAALALKVVVSPYTPLARANYRSLGVYPPTAGANNPCRCTAGLKRGS